MNDIPQTPYFCIDKKGLDEAISGFKNALDAYWPNYMIGYSYKTNSLPWVIEYVKDNGLVAEVVSDDEYNLALAIKADNIIYNGPAKTESTFKHALEHDYHVNIDTKRELRWLKEFCESNSEHVCKVGIRANFDIESYCPGQSACGDEGGRFGFCIDNSEFEHAVEAVGNIPNAVISGLHLHCSSKSRSIEIYTAIAEVACKLQRRYGFKLEYLDIGGGFFGGLSNKPQIADYLEKIVPILNECFDYRKTMLIVEPGMALIGANVDFVSSVIDVKDTTYNRFVLIDGSRNNIDPLMTKSGYFLEMPTDSDGRKVHPKQVLVGYTCMEHDRLCTLVNKPELKEGDVLVFHKVGAYTMCLSPLFIKYFPDCYVMHEDGHLELVRKHISSIEYHEMGKV